MLAVTVSVVLSSTFAYKPSMYVPKMSVENIVVVPEFTSEDTTVDNSPVGCMLDGSGMAGADVVLISLSSVGLTLNGCTGLGASVSTSAVLFKILVTVSRRLFKTVLLPIYEVV